MSYKTVASAEELGIKKVVEDSMGWWLVLDKCDQDDPEYESDQVLFIPFLWDHRRLVDRSEL